MMFCMFLEQLETAKLLRWGPGDEATGHEAPSRWTILAILQKKKSHFNVIWMTFCMFLEQLEKAKSLGGGLGPKPPAAEQF